MAMKIVYGLKIFVDHTLKVLSMKMRWRIDGLGLRTPNSVLLDYVRFWFWFLVTLDSSFSKFLSKRLFFNLIVVTYETTRFSADGSDWHWQRTLQCVRHQVRVSAEIVKKFFPFFFALFFGIFFQKCKEILKIFRGHPNARWMCRWCDDRQVSKTKFGLFPKSHFAGAFFGCRVRGWKSCGTLRTRFQITFTAAFLVPNGLCFRFE